MFAAASGARLAHRHNKATIQKQICSNNLEGLHAGYRAFQRHQNAKTPDLGPGVHHGQRNQIGQRYQNDHHHQHHISQNQYRHHNHRHHHNYTNSKLYSSDSESVLRISSSYIDLHGRIPKFGHVDFEGKAAWQDRELGYDVDRRESSVCATSEAAANHRFKQKEAHKRWVKRNRIHDSTFGDCSSEEDDIYGAYGVQSTAANALLYIGLGTMCIGMIIAFVGTGEKGFKTIELRLIGPSLIGAGVMIIILRVMLCVCPSKCLKLNKHKHKNSTNKLNSEDEECEEEGGRWRGRECGAVRGPEPGPPAAAATATRRRDASPDARTSHVKKSDSKKRVSIVEMPSTSSGRGESGDDVILIPVQERKGQRAQTPPPPPPPPPQQQPSQTAADASSIASDASAASHGGSSLLDGAADGRDSSNQSDVSLNSIANGFLNSDSFDSELSSRTVRNASKFETHRSPKNVNTEIVLSPSNLNELHESD